MNILYVENHPHFAKAVVSEFLSSHKVYVVPTIALAKNAVLAEAFDLALVDYDLDDGKGVDFIAFVKSIGLELQVIACSSHEKGNAALVGAGAIATCPKMDFKNIGHCIENIFEK